MAELSERSPAVFDDAIEGLGMKHVYADLASKGDIVTYKIQGAIHQMHAILADVRLGKVITGIEVKIPILSPKGKLLGHRVYDVVVQNGSQVIRIEAKSWNPKYIVQNVRSSLRGGKVVSEAGEEIAEESGQMLLDMVEMFKNRSSNNFLIEWKFDKRMTDADKEKLIKMLKEEFDPAKEGELAKKLFGYLDLNPNAVADKLAWKQFLGSLQSKIPNMVSRVDNQFN